MIKRICKLFCRMDMFYLIINKKKQLFISKGGPWGGGLAYIYIYIYTYVYTSTHSRVDRIWN